MKKRIVYKRDETIAIIHPAPNSRRQVIDQETGQPTGQMEPEQEWLDRVFDKAMQNPKLAGSDFEDVDEAQLQQKLPASREFRDAWRGTKAGGVRVDPSEKQKIIDRRNQPK